MITGQVFVREAGRHKNGKRLLAVVGIIGVEDDLPLKGEHQYTIAGSLDGLRVFAEHGIDRTELAKGSAAGDLLLDAIWRI